MALMFGQELNQAGVRGVKEGQTPGSRLLGFQAWDLIRAGAFSELGRMV